MKKRETKKSSLRSEGEKESESKEVGAKRMRRERMKERTYSEF